VFLLEITSEEISKYVKAEGQEDIDLVEIITPAAISFCETKLNRPILDSKMDDTNTWTVPEEVRIAVYLVASHWFENRLPTGPVTDEIDFSVNAILRPHRIRNV
jgi:hypothetical protein